MDIDQILEEFDIKLGHLRREKLSVLEQAKKGIALSQRTLTELRDWVVANGFNNQNAEIHFFKNVKMEPYTQLISYMEIYRIENALAPIDVVNRKKFIRTKLDNYHDFFLRHIDFGQYLETGDTYLDAHYYTRKGLENALVPSSQSYYQDPEFCTPKDMLLAQFRAYGQVVLYLQEKLSKIKAEAKNGITNAIGFPQLKWTHSKAAMTELIYALHSCRAINDGSMDIKELVIAFEWLFQIDLGNFYHTFVELRMRKKDPSKFLDLLRAALLKRMDDADD